jgi:hypothetical protein
VNPTLTAIGDQELGMGIISLALYVAGVVWGLLMIDAPPASKIALAILWPLGPLAFAITLTVLLAASVVAFPLWGVVVILSGLTAWWFLLG